MQLRNSPKISLYFASPLRHRVFEEIALWVLRRCNRAMSLGLTGERTVWVIARPTGFYKQQALYHWGILLSPYSKTDLGMLWIAKKPNSSTMLENWGTYMGTCSTSEDTYTRRVIPDFGRQHVLHEWRFSAAEYIGVTSLKDSELLTLGTLAILRN